MKWLIDIFTGVVVAVSAFFGVEPAPAHDVPNTVYIPPPDEWTASTSAPVPVASTAPATPAPSTAPVVAPPPPSLPTTTPYLSARKTAEKLLAALLIHNYEAAYALACADIKKKYTKEEFVEGFRTMEQEMTDRGVRVLSMTLEGESGVQNHNNVASVNDLTNNDEINILFDTTLGFAGVPDTIDSGTMRTFVYEKGAWCVDYRL